MKVAQEHLTPKSPGAYFSIIRDKAIDVGGFFCSACLMGKPATALSPDPRYCQGCHDVLSQEASFLPEGKRPKWRPKNGYPLPQDVDVIMQTLVEEKSEVCIINPTTPIKTHGKRGPKFKPLPEDLIRQLVSDGLGSKAIARHLRVELGQTVHYSTIHRMLAKRGRAAPGSENIEVS